MSVALPHDRRLPPFVERHYTTYLVIIALAGWSLAAYDSNLLVLTFPEVASGLHLSPTLVGSLGFIIFSAGLVIRLIMGYAMDTFGRKPTWMFCLAAAAVLTALTYFVQNFWQLATLRALATGFSAAELGVSITLVNEELPSRVRGLLYSVVQGGWPVGVFLASAVYLTFHQLGWRVVFVFGIIPMIAVIIGRYWIKEPARFLHLKQIREAKRTADEASMERLLHEYNVNVNEIDKITFKQLLWTKGYVRDRVLILSLVWFFYATAFVATNVYITYWLTHYEGWSGGAAGRLLLVSSGIGFAFYVLGGALGERWGRREVLVWTGVLTGPLNLLFLFLHDPVAVAITYFCIYQVTNGTWSGAGYAYWAECFPTRVRGTAIGILSAVISAGFIVGSLLWTVLIGGTSPEMTWLVVAVLFGFGQWTAFLLPKIAPGQTLEAIAT
jgi:MFS family permease